MLKKIIIILLIISITLIIIGLFKNNKSMEKENTMTYNLKITVNNEELIIELVDNEATQELINKLLKQDIVVNASEYDNFEKVGDLGFTLPSNDTKIKTEPGDLMLYQSHQITLFYNSNTWSYTRLGKVINKSPKELKQILGQEDVIMTLSLIEK